jgi:hypothetical protein
MTDAQTTAEPADQNDSHVESPEAEAAIAAMVTAWEEIYGALAKAWPAIVVGYQSGGPHPLESAAMVLCRVQWDITTSWIENGGQSKAEDRFFQVAKSCLVNLTQGLQDVANQAAQQSSETLQ